MKWKIPAFIFLLALTCQVAYMQDDDIDVEEDFDEDDEDSGVPELEPMERPVYKRPEVDGSAYFSEAFDSEAAFSKKWVKSAAKKDDVEEEIAKYDGVWKLEEPSKNPLQGDIGLVLKSKAKHHAIAAALSKHVDFSAQSLYIQYEVKFQNGQDCGGAYIKLLSADKLKLEQFKDSTPYTIMFGPDKCGNDNKLHFIFRHKNPVTGEYEEKHAKKPNKPSDTAFTDKKTHLYTLALNADNTFEIFVDQDLVNSGSLLEDFEPSVNPPKQIVDPEDKKPEDWDEREKIPDPDAVKPDDWDETQPEMIDDESAEKPEGWLDDEPELIPDPDAEMPGDWDEDMDGEWEAPLVSNPLCESAPGCGEWTAPQIKNPLYKGKWRPEMIENPSYQGKWKARMIDNPHFFEDKNPYKMTPIGAIGLELWSMSNDIVFDNFIITHSKATLDKWSSDTWELKHQVELSASGSAGFFNSLVAAAKDQPYLWLVYMLVLMTPVVFIPAWIMSKSGSAKKTDAVTPDDEEDEATGDTVDDSGDSAANGDSGDSAAGRTKTTKSGKSQLETAEDTGEGEGEEPTEESPKRRSTRKRNKPQKE